MFDKMRNVFVDDLRLDSYRDDNMYFAHAHFFLQKEMMEQDLS